MPKKTLPPSTIKAIKESTDPVQTLARRYRVSISTISRHRPSRRNHLSELERDQVVQDWVSGIRTRDTCERFRIERQTIYKNRREALRLALGGNV